jgi:hypothetical protein
VCIALLQVGDTVSVHVDYDRRSFVAPNHTMTHVLNYALRHVLIGNGRCFDSYAARRVTGVLRSDAFLERSLYLCHTCSCLMWL